MSGVFEQPAHMNAVVYCRLVRMFWPLVLPFALVLSAVCVLGLWFRAAEGEQISTWRWMGAASVGVLMIALMRLKLLLESSRRRWIEFTGDRIVLAHRGAVAVRRFSSWSPSPDPVESRYTHLELTYKFGFGRKRWSMLLDDETQVEELRRALTAAIQLQGAVSDGVTNAASPHRRPSSVNTGN